MTFNPNYNIPFLQFSGGIARRCFLSRGKDGLAGVRAGCNARGGGGGGGEAQEQDNGIACIYHDRREACPHKRNR